LKEQACSTTKENTEVIGVAYLKIRTEACQDDFVRRKRFFVDFDDYIAVRAIAFAKFVCSLTKLQSKREEKWEVHQSKKLL